MIEIIQDEPIYFNRIFELLGLILVSRRTPKTEQLFNSILLKLNGYGITGFKCGFLDIPNKTISIGRKIKGYLNNHPALKQIDDYYTFI